MNPTCIRISRSLSLSRPSRESKFNRDREKVSDQDGRSEKVSSSKQFEDDFRSAPWTIPSSRGLFVVQPRSYLRGHLGHRSDLSPTVPPFSSGATNRLTPRALNAATGRADGSTVSGTVIFATPTKSGAASFSHDPGNRTLLLNTIRSAKPFPLSRTSCALPSDFSP